MGFTVRFRFKCLLNYYCIRGGEERFKIKTGQHCFTYNPRYISYRTYYNMHFMREWFKIFYLIQLNYGLSTLSYKFVRSEGILNRVQAMTIEPFRHEMP